MNDFTERRMNREAMAARDLLAQLASDDECLAHDMVEGETSFLEAVAKALDEMHQAQALADGVAALIERYESRKAMAERRVARVKIAIEQAMIVSDMKTLSLSAATLTVKATPPKAIITNEALIPAEFWKPSPPKLDRAALNAAAKAGSIPGVEMTNGGVALQVRMK